MIKCLRWLLPVCCTALTACQSAGGVHLAAHEIENFTAKPTQQRIMNAVKLRWEVRPDVADYCAKVSGMDRERAYFTPPLACSIWSVAAQECTIVTGPNTSHLALGHEVRHCFEGHFHP